MEVQHQQTLKKSVRFSGIGLHSGNIIRGTLHPAPPDTGITFRIQRPRSKPVYIQGRFRNIGGLTYNTTLVKDNVHVLTVEHLMSAFHGFGIDNAMVELDNGEVPVMDGSAAPFVYLLSEAGIQQQDAPRRTLRLTRKIEIRHNTSYIVAEPSSKNVLELEYSIEFDHPAIGYMKRYFADDASEYCTAIAPARTFGFLKEVEYLRRKGLIKGASLQNAVVLNDFRIISDSLRFPDEFVRHKILDFWGDIMLFGRPLIAKIRAHRAGHHIHAMFVEKLLKTPNVLEPVFERIPHRIVNLAPQPGV